MKAIIKNLILTGLIVSLFAACGPRPQYKTSRGKKKLKYYNAVQYGKETPKQIKSLKRNRR
jgi:hypothetical protein